MTAHILSIRCDRQRIATARTSLPIHRVDRQGIRSRSDACFQLHQATIHSFLQQKSSEGQSYEQAGAGSFAGSPPRLIHNSGVTIRVG